VPKPGGKCESFVDLCDWLFETYQHTSRDTLLEFMANTKDIELLNTLDLAIAYLERMAGTLQKPKDVADIPQPTAFE
jgi:hypothetical protein